MKSLVFWIFVAILGATAVTTEVHVHSMDQSRSRLARIQTLYERTSVFPELDLAMETYRAASGNFHKMYNAQIAAAKATFRGDMTKDLDQLDQLDPTSDDRATVKKIRSEVDELMRLCAKYEPQLFLKDAYYKPDVQALHQTILNDIASLQQSNQARLEQQRSTRDDATSRSLRLIVATQLAILLLVCLMIARAYLIHVRPAKRLAEYARALVRAPIKPETPSGLPELEAEVAGTLAELNRQSEQLREQRRKFIEDVIEDIRPGLAALKRSTDHQEATAVLSASLDDLKQLAEISRIDQKIHAGVVDLSELLNDTCKRATMAGLCPDVRVSVPELPTWVSLDAGKMERAMIQILARLGDSLEKGQNVEASLQVRGKGGLNGVEVSFYTSGNRVPGAPEQELPRHWIAQKGLALTLAQKVVKAQGGSIFAAGLIGSPVQISIKFPKSILTDGLVSPVKYPTARTSVDVDNFNAT